MQLKLCLFSFFLTKSLATATFETGVEELGSQMLIGSGRPGSKSFKNFRRVLKISGIVFNWLAINLTETVFLVLGL